MTLPLSDIKVADFSQGLAGPLVSMHMGDLGADVVKLEPPEGDNRDMMSIPGAKDMSIGFITVNRNKRSMVLDITKPKGCELAYALVRWADVVVMNMRVGARQRRGLTYEDLAAVNPRLIYVSVTAYGELGPEADLGGVDIVVQARAGDQEGRRPAGGPPPSPTNMVHYDMATPWLALSGILLALRERDHTGLGQKVEVNLLQTALALQPRQMTRIAGSDLAFPAMAPRSTPSTYLCSDDRYIFAPSLGERWTGFCQALGLTHLATDPRFDTLEKRFQGAKELSDFLAGHFATRPAAEWEALLKAKGIGVSVVKTYSEVHEDPQVIANHMIIQYEQPGVGLVKLVNFPVRMSGIPANELGVHKPFPTKGEHTDEVLRELGHTPQEIASLRAEGVIA